MFLNLGLFEVVSVLESEDFSVVSSTGKGDSVMFTETLVSVLGMIGVFPLLQKNYKNLTVSKSVLVLC